MNTFDATYDGPALAGDAIAHDRSRFNRLRRTTPDAAVPIAAGIFLDVFNVFLLALDLFGGQRD